MTHPWMALTYLDPPTRPLRDEHTQPGEQTPISQLNLFLFTPAADEISPRSRQRLALEYITRFGGPGEVFSWALLFAAGIQQLTPSTLLYAKVNNIMPEIQELKTRLNFCQYLWETPEAMPVRTFDRLQAQDNAMRSESAALLRLHGEHIAIIEEPFFMDVIGGCIRQYTPEDRTKIRAVGNPPVHPDPRVIGVLFFLGSTRT